MSATLQDLGESIAAVNVANGWYDGAVVEPTPEAAITLLALVVTEASEAIEEVRNGHPVTDTYYVTPIANQPTWDREAYIALFGSIPKPEGVPSELADILIRTIDIANRWGIDLEAAVTEKITHNASRGRRHGGKTA